VLWIDAICINQNDLKERGQQVKRMASIYKMARRVVVWLGEEEDNSTMALRTLEMLSTKISPPDMRKAIKPTSTPGSEAHWADPTAHLPFNDLEWTSINDLFGRAWFERLWIWQEIRMANRDAIILCGFSTIRWEAFCNGVHCLSRKTFPVDLPKYWRRRSNISHLGSNQGHRPFTELVRQTRFSKCSDPKDRVYALFSMAPVEEGIIIEPDYTKSVHEVYTELFMNRLEHTKSLRLLRFCELRQPCQGMPTWVPDWSCPSISDRLPDCLASGISTTDAYVTGKATLRVKGLHLTTIKHVEVFPLLDDSTMVKIGEELLRLASGFNLQSSPMEKGGRLELFWRTINGNMFSDCFYPPAHSFPNFQLGIKALYDGLAGNAVNLEFRPHLLFGRSVFETYDGYIGLAPKGTKENDFVCLLLGCNLAMILRPNGSGQYQVVGESYCHGFMSGEAILGPLPEHFERILRFEESIGAEFSAYIDRETGSVQAEDPRPIPLPIGWRKQERQESLVPWYMNDEDGTKSTWVDPRLTPKALRERGVDLKTFELV
jgi:hypothetical protein